MPLPRAGIDVVIVDTAGRLHTKVNLMDELAKIRRTIGKRLPEAQPEVLFVLDATTGQNGLIQARAFHEATGLTAIALTKLDSTSKGGVAFADRAGGRRAGPLRRRRRADRGPARLRPERVRGRPLRPTRPRGVADASARESADRPEVGRTAVRPAHGPDPAPPLESAPVFDALSDRLRGALGRLTGHGRITEEDVDIAMREVRLALLEADVNYKVVKDFVARVRERAVGAEVIGDVNAGQMVVKIVHEELTAILGAGDRTFRMTGSPAVIAMVGLQGSGKTTSAAKLARWIVRQGRQPLLVAADPYRPAAVDQLVTLGGVVSVPVYSGAVRDAGRRHLLAARVAEARRTGRDVVILDTAGRLDVDEQLMAEIARGRGRGRSRSRRCSSSTRCPARRPSPSPRPSATRSASPASC